MSKPAPKYRNLLFYILLLSYVISSLQAPLYEVIHFLAHVEVGTHSDYHFHSYHEHDHSHEHITLNILDHSHEDQKDDQIPKEVKKKVETSNSPHWSNLTVFEYRIDNFKITFPFSTLAMELTSPPPERI